VHHHRKGIAIAGDPDSARGAGSLVNASRLVKTATKMSEQEATLSARCGNSWWNGGVAP
jgi:hypothetical protein